MISHRPLGRGHPYLLEPDQRVPAHPIVGQPYELRVTTSAEVAGVMVEFDSDAPVREVPAVRREAVGTEVAPFARTIETAANDEQTHLEEAAARATGRQPGRIGWSVSGPVLGSEPVRYRFRTSGPAGREETEWYELVPAAWTRGGATIDVVFAARSDGEPLERLRRRYLPETLAALVRDRSVLRARFALRLDASEHVVGFGERFDVLDQRGRELDAVVFEQYRAQGARTYLPMPFAFVLGDEPWGFHVATARRTWFDVGATDPALLWIEADLDGARPAALSLELYGGPPEEILSAFLRNTGAPPVPPAWIFEPWMSANEWNTQARVMAEVERSEREGIPAGVLVIEAWSDEETFVAFRDAAYSVHADGAPHRLADFRFPPDGAWPDPKRLVDDLHARGMRVLLWQIPLQKTGMPAGSQARADEETMIARGYAVREADGAPYRNRGWWFPDALLPDFTAADVREWWLAKRRYLIEELGIDGFKTDGGEHAWGNELRYADGTRGSETNNRYPVLYAGAYHGLFRELGHEGITFSRAGFTGAPAYPSHWAGDEASTWDAFRASITAGLTAGACGIFFWGWDIAGFSGEIPSAELYLRATAAACFCPIMQYHSEYNHHREPSRDRTPWNIGERTGDPRVVPTYRRFAVLRRALVPYLAEQSQRAVTSGQPLMRALFFEFAADPRIWDFPRQYLFGDDLLVAPVTEAGAATWLVYLPTGEWIDAWTGERLSGPMVVQRAAPLDEIPVYARCGTSADVRRAFALARAAEG